jgi:nitrite reductase/ring-hydroxylating ferredoxin subunit
MKTDVAAKYPRAKAILEEMKESIKDGIIPAGIFNDKEIYEMEIEQIFARKWILLGHESEIAEPGDYVLRYIGEDPFIVTRDESGQINVLLDACCHRGVRVCQAEQGNTSHFRCPYHGWIYKNNGTLIGMPAQKQAYNGMNKQDWGLIKARWEVFHGFIFGCLSPDTPPLETYLADQKFYLDMLFGLEKGGLEVIGEPQRWVVNANWKLAAENFSGDDYHLIFLHHSASDIGATPYSMFDNMKGYHIHAGNGHCVSISLERGQDGANNEFPYWNFPKEISDQFDQESLTEKQKEIVRDSKEMLGNIYPNSSFLVMSVVYDRDLPPVPFFSIRQWRPLGPGKIEIWNWMFMYKNTPESFKEASYRAGMTNFSMSGVFEMDDTLTWETATYTAGNYYSKNNLKLNYQMGMNGMGSAMVDEEWPCPGTAYYPRYGEGNQRYLYTTYLKDMLGDQNK